MAQAIAAPSPTFADKTSLARYVDPDELQSDGHAAVSAFEMSSHDLGAKTPYLSVNSLELDSLVNVAEHYRTLFQDGAGRVAIAVHKVIDYVTKGKTAGASLTKLEESWRFVENDEAKVAFKHRPPHNTHCGVEFVRSLSDLQRRRFAREMAKRPRLHLLDE